MSLPESLSPILDMPGVSMRQYLRSFAGYRYCYVAGLREVLDLVVQLDGSYKSISKVKTAVKGVKGHALDQLPQGWIDAAPGCDWDEGFSIAQIDEAAKPHPISLDRACLIICTLAYFLVHKGIKIDLSRWIRLRPAIYVVRRFDQNYLFTLKKHELDGKLTAYDALSRVMTRLAACCTGRSGDNPQGSAAHTLQEMTEGVPTTYFTAKLVVEFCRQLGLDDPLRIEGLEERADNGLLVKKKRATLSEPVVVMRDVEGAPIHEAATAIDYLQHMPKGGIT